MWLAEQVFSISFSGSTFYLVFITLSSDVFHQLYPSKLIHVQSQPSQYQLGIQSKLALKKQE